MWHWGLEHSYGFLLAGRGGSRTVSTTHVAVLQDCFAFCLAKVVASFESASIKRTFLA